MWAWRADDGGLAPYEPALSAAIEAAFVNPTKKSVRVCVRPGGTEPTHVIVFDAKFGDHKQHVLRDRSLWREVRRTEPSPASAAGMDAAGAAAAPAAGAAAA